MAIQSALISKSLMFSLWDSTLQRFGVRDAMLKLISALKRRDAFDP
jgi:hypothetical protein